MYGEDTRGAARRASRTEGGRGHHVNELAELLNKPERKIHRRIYGIQDCPSMC